MVDDETPGLVLSESSLSVAEGDSVGDTYTVRLATPPTADVTVTVSGQAGTDVTLGGLSATGTLTFTPTNWNVAQTVTVAAGEDDDAGDDSVTLTHTATGAEYAGVTAELAVTVADDETPQVVLTPASLNVDEGDATGGTYTVRLATPPTADVTVTVSGQAGTDVTLGGLSGTGTLTFTPTSWNVAQTVTVTAGEDDDGADDSVTLTHTAAGGEYAGVTAELAVTVADDETPQVVLTPASLGVGEGDATGGTYTVRLATPPTADVTVTVSGQAGSDLTLGGLSGTGTLTFTPTSWNVAQTVTVTAGEDDDGADDSVTLTHTAAGGEYAGVTAELAVTVADNDRRVVLTPVSLGVSEGDSTGDTYTVRLATEPTANVTVTVSGQAGTDLTLGGLSGSGTLTFTTTDWDVAQTVTVTAAEDDDGADDSVTLTHTATGGNYAGVTARLEVTVADNDRRVVLTPASLSIDEGDATGGTYTVRLASVPTATVAVTVTGQIGTDLTLNGLSTTGSLTFTRTDWNVAQTVTVTAAEDDDAGDDTVTLTHTATGGNFTGVAATLTVTVADDDRGILLTPAVLSVDEGDSVGGTYTVRLAGAPSETTTVTVSGQAGSDLALGGLSGSGTLTFTTTDWNVARTVTVTAGEDDDGVDDSVTLTHTAAGGEYAGVAASLAVTVVDNDRAIVLAPGSLSVGEGDTTGATYTVRLATEPTADVTVTVSGQAGSDLTLGGLSGSGTLTFTPTSWNVAQTVTVTAAEDDDAADDSVILTHTAAGGEYAGVTAELAVTVVDDESAGLVLSVSSLSVDEGDSTGGSYSVRLATPPTADVTVTVSGQAGSDLTLGGLSGSGTLTFTPTNWNVAQTVTVTAGEDDDGADDSVTLTHTAAGGEYAGVAASLVVTVIDDDRRVILSDASLAVDEGDATGATYTVRLATPPTVDVTVTVSGQAGTDLTLGGLSGSGTLTFTPTSWNVAQSVTVTAGEDDDAADDSVILTHTATGGGYAGVAAELAVTVVDDGRRRVGRVGVERVVVECG